MKAYVSIDLEGLPGVASVTMVSPERSQFSVGSRIATIIAKEVTSMLLENGFSKVVVADSHGLMTNIDYTQLPKGAVLIQGYPRPFSMVIGIDDSFDAALFIGYHAAAGTMHGFLDHTMSGRVFHEIRVNDMRFSEYLLNSLYVGERNVPVILLAGDDHLRDEVVNHTPWTVFIDLKRGLSRYSAMYESMDEVLEKLRKGIQVAVNRLKRGETKPFTLDKPYRSHIVLRESLVADVLEQLPGIRRIDAYTVEYIANNATELLGMVESIAMIGYGIEMLKNSIK